MVCENLVPSANIVLTESADQDATVEFEDCHICSDARLLRQRDIISTQKAYKRNLESEIEKKELEIDDAELDLVDLEERRDETAVDSEDDSDDEAEDDAQDDADIEAEIQQCEANLHTLASELQVLEGSLQATTSAITGFEEELKNERERLILDNEVECTRRARKGKGDRDWYFRKGITEKERRGCRNIRQQPPTHVPEEGDEVFDALDELYILDGDDDILFDE